MKPQASEYVLTIAQHTYCNDCMWLKNKITDVYHFSGIVRGEDSKHWHINIISPHWSREHRQKSFPRGFATVDVPAMKLEVDERLIFATQDPNTVSELLAQLKLMLMDGLSNNEIEKQLTEIYENLGGRSQEPAFPELACSGV